MRQLLSKNIEKQTKYGEPWFGLTAAAVTSVGVQLNFSTPTYRQWDATAYAKLNDWSRLYMCRAIRRWYVRTHMDQRNS